MNAAGFAVIGCIMLFGGLALVYGGMTGTQTYEETLQTDSYVYHGTTLIVNNTEHTDVTKLSYNDGNLTYHREWNDRQWMVVGTLPSMLSFVPFLEALDSSHKK